jgi:hypothetical protein
METVKAYCRTNLDDYKIEIDEFYRIPLQGEFVECLYKGKPAKLAVHSITHKRSGSKPFIEVELHKPIVYI